MEHVAGVEKYLVGSRAVHALESRDAIAPASDLARSFAAALEVTSAGTASLTQVRIHLVERDDRDREVR